MIIQGIFFLLLIQVYLAQHCGDNKIRIPRAFRHELRFLLFSDIYTLTPLARISTAVKHYQQKDVPLILVLPGDFLFPIDKIEYDYGKSMVRILNELSEFGIISLGNHEDIDLKELNKRMEEFKYPIVASNFPSSVLSCLQPSVILEMNEEPILGFIGLLSHSHNVVPKISFGGHPMGNPFEAAQQLAEDFRRQHLDMIALTHMEMEEDKQLVSQLADHNLLAVFGGHDHEIILPKEEEQESGPIFKCGINGDAFCVLDFAWNKSSPSVKPSIHMHVEHSRDFEEDPRILEMINAVPLDNSTFTKFFEIPMDIHAETVTVRRQPSSMAGLILQYLVDSFEGKAEMALFSGGNLRGEKVFTNGDYFTLRDIKDLLPWVENYPVIVPLPGQLIEDWIIMTRGKPSAAYLQVNRNLTVEKETNKILSVNGETFDPNRIYQVIVNNIALNGTDNHTLFLEYLDAHKELKENIPIYPNFPEIFINHFSKLFLKRILNSMTVYEVDANHDHKLDVNELSSAFANIIQLQPTPPLMSAMLQLLGALNPFVNDAFVEERMVASYLGRNSTTYNEGAMNEEFVSVSPSSSFQTQIPPPTPAVLLELETSASSSEEQFQQ